MAGGLAAWVSSQSERQSSDPAFLLEGLEQNSEPASAEQVPRWCPGRASSRGAASNPMQVWHPLLQLSSRFSPLYPTVLGPPPGTRLRPTVLGPSPSPSDPLHSPTPPHTHSNPCSRPCPTVPSLCRLHQQLTAQNAPGGHGESSPFFLLPHPQPRVLGMKGSLHSHSCAHLLPHPRVSVGWDWALTRVMSSHGRHPSPPCPAAVWTWALCSVRRLKLQPQAWGDAHREMGRHTYPKGPACGPRLQFCGSRGEASWRVPWRR